MTTLLATLAVLFRPWPGRRSLAVAAALLLAVPRSEPAALGHTLPMPAAEFFGESAPSGLDESVCPSIVPWESAQAPPLPQDGLLPEEIPLPDPEAGEFWGDQPAESDLLGKEVILTPSGDDASCPVFREFCYRGAGHETPYGWVVGHGDRMGILTLAMVETSPFQIPDSNLRFDWAIHFVSGPKRTDLPARLYDLAIAIERRAMFTEWLGYDLRIRAGCFTDFEGSAREGWRFPATGVLYYRRNDRRKWLLGVDVLDRDDVLLLPVFGAVLTPCDAVRLELVFPRPRIAVQTRSDRWIYCTAEMGGGTWAIERASGADDVATYRDFRLLLGWQDRPNDQHTFFTEIGLVFGRHLEYRSGGSDYQPLPTTILQSVLTY